MFTHGVLSLAIRKVVFERPWYTTFEDQGVNTRPSDTSPNAQRRSERWSNVSDLIKI